MELLEGQTLKARLRDRALPWPEVVEIGLQLADALEAAHAKGIIHRDIKPANIFLTTRGTAKLLDFGLVRLAAEPHRAISDEPTAAGESITRAGVLLGTLSYMAPEQFAGTQADARSDLFSLGLVLYEMAAGQRYVSPLGLALAHASIDLTIATHGHFDHIGSSIRLREATGAFHA
jgi:serine/threonine protein kinase